MSSKPIRVGMIGLGIIGTRVAKGLTEHAETRIAAVCDTNGETAARFAASLGGVSWSTDYRTMLEGDQVDMVYVGVPPRFHHRIALDVIAAGKHIFCEKPLALTLSEAREMTQAVQASGLVNAVNLPIHGSPGVRLFADQLKAGYIGEYRRAELNLVFPQWPRGWQQNPWIGKREQGGPIREVGPHMFHVILQSIGQVYGPVARVRADVQYPANDPEACEVNAHGLFELAGGQLIAVNAICNVPRPESVSLTVYGTEGTLGLANWSDPVGARDSGPLQPLSLPSNARPSLIDQLVRAIRGEQVDLPTFAHGLILQQLLEAWERAAESGTWVNV